MYSYACGLRLSQNILVFIFRKNFEFFLHIFVSPFFFCGRTDHIMLMVGPVCRLFVRWLFDWREERWDFAQLLRTQSSIQICLWFSNIHNVSVRLLLLSLFVIFTFMEIRYLFFRQWQESVHRQAVYMYMLTCICTYMQRHICDMYVCRDGCCNLLEAT